MPKKRSPAVAGSFYESSKETLVKRLRWCFTHFLGPGVLPSDTLKRSGEAIGLISPHAGYMYSGPIAANGFYEISLRLKPEIFIIIGPNHHGIGSPIALSSSEYWETPLGDVRVNLEFAKDLAKKTGIIEFDDTAHLFEHSVEVQLPFLQYIYGGNIEIVPIVMMLQSLEASKILGEAIAALSSELNVKTLVIASTDFTHYEPHEIAIEKDKAAINCILSLDSKGLYNTIFEKNISMCGPGPVMALMEYARRTCGKPALIKYATSGDVTGDKSAVVGYASIIFARKTQ